MRLALSVMPSMFQRPRSSVVNMRLITNGETHSVSQSGPDFLILAEPAKLPAGETEPTVTVDGEETKQRCQITEPVNGVRINASRLENTSELDA